MIPTNFNEIYSVLTPLKPCIKISYLKPMEMRKVLNFPHKEHFPDISSNDIDFIESQNGLFLVIMQNGDISNLPKEYRADVNKILVEKLKSIKPLGFKEISYINKKLALVLAGLGQYSRNQLVYNTDYGFFHMTRIFSIYTPVNNLPQRNQPIYTYTEMCKNCNECIKNCPAQAIHDDKYFSWVDRVRCEDYCFFGESDKFFTVKYSINKFWNNKFSKEQLLQIKDAKSFKNLFGFDCQDAYIPDINGNIKLLGFDSCRECMNQLPCRKQKYIYNKAGYIEHKGEKLEI